MTFRARRVHILLIGVLGLLAPAMAARGQAIVVTARSASELADDLEYLVKSVAPEDNPATQAILDALKNFKAGALVKGLDRTRGFGLAVMTSPMAVLPRSPSRCRSRTSGSSWTRSRTSAWRSTTSPGAAGFSHKVSVGDGNVTLFVVESKGYALFSPIPDGADKLKAMDPATWWKKGRPETALSVKIQFAGIPDAFKDQFLNQMEAQARQQEERQPGEDEAQYKARVAGQDLAYEGFRGLVRDGDAMALNLDLDRKNRQLALELAFTARPDTGMAKSLRALNGRRSRFEGLGQDAVMAFWANLPMAKELRKVMSRRLRSGVQGGLEERGFRGATQAPDALRRADEGQPGCTEIDAGMAMPAVGAGRQGRRPFPAPRRDGGPGWPGVRSAGPRGDREGLSPRRASR